jgi:hypothetical protein
MAKVGGKDHQKRLQKTHEKIARALQNADLSLAQRVEYRLALFEIIDNLTPAAICPRVPVLQILRGAYGCDCREI